MALVRHFANKLHIGDNINVPEVLNDRYESRMRNDDQPQPPKKTIVHQAFKHHRF